MTRVSALWQMNQPKSAEQEQLLGGEGHQPHFSATCKTRALAVPLANETFSFITTGRTMSQQPQRVLGGNLLLRYLRPEPGPGQAPVSAVWACSLTWPLRRLTTSTPANLDGEPALPGERGHHRHADRGSRPVAPGARPALRLQTSHSGDTSAEQPRALGKPRAVGRRPQPELGAGTRSCQQARSGSPLV